MLRISALQCTITVLSMLLAPDVAAEDSDILVSINASRSP